MSSSPPTPGANSATAPFVISRVFAARRELVFQCCTEPAHLTHWWGPKGVEIRVAKLELRPGGIFHYNMLTPDGHVMWGRFVFREISPPARLVFINSFSNENAGLTRHPGSDMWPLEMLTVFTFTEHAGQTTFRIEWTPYNSTPAECETFDKNRPSMTQGWSGSLDKLTAHLATLKS